MFKTFTPKHNSNSRYSAIVTTNTFYFDLKFESVCWNNDIYILIQYILRSCPLFKYFRIEYLSAFSSDRCSTTGNNVI